MINPRTIENVWKIITIIDQNTYKKKKTKIMIINTVNITLN